MRILFFGIYDPDYSRNRVLAKGLSGNGVQVIHCTARSGGPLKYLKLAWMHWRLRRSYDAMLVAFPGQSVMLLARVLTRRPILFDAFTSHYEGYVLDRKTVSPTGLYAHWYRWLDRTSCRLANAVLTDTRAHKDYFAHEFGIPAEKIHPILVGTDMPLIQGAGPEPVGSFTVHFHGSNIPLQGIDVIWGAVRRLWSEPIRFQMIGPFAVPGELRAHVHHEERVQFAELAPRMALSHVCLGIFGVSPKTQRVIPNKVYEALAAAKPVITSDTPAIRELLDGDSALLVPAGDADALAKAIVRLKDDGALRNRLAAHGRDILMQKASPGILGRQVKTIFEALL